MDAEIVALRRSLHAWPEVSGREERTSERIRRELAACNPSRLITDLGGMGVCAVYESGHDGPNILLRAELDALPIAECTAEIHSSQVAGVMHACGHDGHMAALIGVARTLRDRSPTAGSVGLLFQPAEETGTGARAVAADPAFDGIPSDEAYAIHNLPGAPLGAVDVASGIAAYGSVGLRVTVIGSSSHASEPDRGCAVAPRLGALAANLAALTPESGSRPSALATVTYLRCGEPAFGLSPGCGELGVALRAQTDKALDTLLGRAESLCTCLGEAFAVEIERVDSFAATVNTANEAVTVRQAAHRAGLSVISGFAPTGWSEDFGLLINRAGRGALVLMGSGENQRPLHANDYDFPDELLAPMMKFWLSLLVVRGVLDA